MPSAEQPSTQWLIALPTGTEGPYQASELRDLIRAGRIRPDDRLTDQATQRICQVIDVVPFARDLGVGTDRIRRRSGASDRQRVVEPGTGSEVRRFRTPLPGMAPVEASPSVPAASAPTAPPEPPLSAPAPARRRRIILVGMLVVLLAAFVTELVIWPFADGRAAGLQPYGVWRTTRIGDMPGPWEVMIAENAVAITGPDGMRFDVAATMVPAGDHAISAQLSSPHQQLGELIGLHGEEGNVVLTTARGSGAAERIP